MRTTFRFLALLVGLLLGVSALAACGGGAEQEDEPGRYVATGGTVYDQVEGDYELACVDQETGFYVDDDLCEGGQDHGHYDAVFFAMPVGSSHGHGYYEHRVGTKHYPTSTMLDRAPTAGRQRVHMDTGRVTLFTQGKQAGQPVKYNQDAAKLASVTKKAAQDAESAREAKKGGLFGFGGGSKDKGTNGTKTTTVKTSSGRR